MINQSELNRTICLVDNFNLFNTQASLGWRLDWVKFDSWMHMYLPVWQTYLFMAKDKRAKNLVHVFHKLNFIVKQYERKTSFKTCPNCNEGMPVIRGGGLSVALATRMLLLANNKAFNTLVLVCADEDVIEGVEHILNLGFRVEYFDFRYSMNENLSRAVSKTIILDDLKDKISMARD